MLSIPATPSWLTTVRNHLQEWLKSHHEAADPAVRYSREHPGTLCIGRVLCHGETFRGLQVSTLLVGSDALVLLNSEGNLALSIPRERIHGVECAPATQSACRDRQPLQGEEHVFVRFEDDQGRESHLEISVGAMDDIGPVRQLCDCLRSRIGAVDSAA